MKAAGGVGTGARPLVNHAQEEEISEPTVLLAAVVPPAMRVSEVLERKEKEDHFAFLVLYGHNIQQAPEGHTWRGRGAKSFISHLNYR